MVKRQQAATTPALFDLSALQGPRRAPAPGAVSPAGPSVPDLSRSDHDLLGAWARGRARQVTVAAVGGLRFAFYWRVSTEDHQDPVTSRAWQLGQALVTLCGEGRIVVEFSDVGRSRTVAPQQRPVWQLCWRPWRIRTAASTLW